MKRMILGGLGVVAAMIAVHLTLAEVKADYSVGCEPPPCEEIDSATCDTPASDCCFAKNPLVSYGGWFEAGFYANSFGQKNHYFPHSVSGFMPNSGNTWLLNNVENNGFQLNSEWLFAEKRLARNGIDVGGRIDFVVGTDAEYTQSAGMEYATKHSKKWGAGDYFLSFAQLYGEIGNQKANVKIGKFLSPLGFESIMAPNRFFYSLNLGFRALPVTNTGVIGTWNPSRQLSLFGGWVNGYDATFDSSDNNAFLGGFNYKMSKKSSIRYSVMLGKNKDGLEYNKYGFLIDPNYGKGKINKNNWGDLWGKSGPIAGTENEKYFVQLLEFTHSVGRWENIAAWILRNEEVGAGAHLGAYGLCDELIYRFNRKWAAGVRAEWMHWYGLNTSINTYEMTFGLNWTPNNRFLLRPEIRYDVVNGADPFNTLATRERNAHPSDHQFSGGLSGVYCF